MKLEKLVIWLLYPFSTSFPTVNNNYNKSCCHCGKKRINFASAVSIITWSWTHKVHERTERQQLTHSFIYYSLLCVTSCLIVRWKRKEKMWLTVSQIRRKKKLLDQKFFFVKKEKKISRCHTLVTCIQGRKSSFPFLLGI